MNNVETVFNICMRFKEGKDLYSEKCGFMNRKLLSQQEKVLRLRQHIGTVVSIIVSCLIAVGWISDGLCKVCFLLPCHRKLYVFNCMYLIWGEGE